jgi:transposase
MHDCIKTKPNSRRMDGLSITIIMTVFDPRERERWRRAGVYKKRMGVEQLL